MSSGAMACPSSDLSDAAPQSSFEGDLLQIRKDIPRTFPEEPAVRSASHVIEAILVEHARFDPELGYCQGMSNVAAVVASHVPDAAGASSFFRRLVENLRGLWLPGFPLLTAGTAAFEALQRSAMPELHEHLVGLGASSDMFLPDAWLTLFSRWLPFASLWPLFAFLEDVGLPGLVSLTAVLLQAYERPLLGAEDFTELFVLLKTLGKAGPPPDAQAVLDGAQRLLPQVRSLLPSHALLMMGAPAPPSPSSRSVFEGPRLVRRGSRVFHAHSNLEAIADDLDLESLQRLALRTLTMQTPGGGRQPAGRLGCGDSPPKQGGWLSLPFSSCTSCLNLERSSPIERMSDHEWL